MMIGDLVPGEHKVIGKYMSEPYWKFQYNDNKRKWELLRIVHVRVMDI